MSQAPIRVVIAKPGLDGHVRGAQVVEAPGVFDGSDALVGRDRHGAAPADLGELLE